MFPELHFSCEFIFCFLASLKRSGALPFRKTGSRLGIFTILILIRYLRLGFLPSTALENFPFVLAGLRIP